MKGGGRAGAGGVKSRVYVKGNSSKVVKYANRTEAKKKKAFFDAVEKKQFDVFQNNLLVGADAGQYNTTQITPFIPQGSGEANRIGNKIMLTGATFDLQVTTQPNTINAVRYKYWVIRQEDAGVPLSAGNVVPKFLDPNVFSTIGAIDYHSQRRTEYMKEFKIVCQGKGLLTPDNLTGQKSLSQVRRYLKLNLPQRYLTDASTTSVLNQL